MANINLTIASGQSLSDMADLSVLKPVALIAPAAWSDAAPLSFQMSHNGGTFYNVSRYDTDQVLTIPVVPNHWVPLDPSMFDGAIFMRVRSGHPQHPVAQAAQRVFILVCRDDAPPETPPAVEEAAAD